MELIQRLESNINALDQTYKTKSGIVYIGKSSICRERDRNNNNNINISSSWEIKEWRRSWEDDDNKKWLFWTRIESMLLSRINFLRNSSSGQLDENVDKVAKDFKKLLSYDKNCQTWVIFDYGFVIEDGLVMLDAISEVTEPYTIYYEFAKALEERCKQLRATSPSHAYKCSRLEFRTETPPESIKCAECGRSMEKCIALLCCHNHQQP